MKQDTYVNVKLEIVVHEFVNSDLCANVKHDVETQVSFQDIQNKVENVRGEQIISMN